MIHTLDPRNILVDGKKVGDVISYQITWSEIDGCKICTIRYTINGKERTLTCEVEAISFATA